MPKSRKNIHTEKALIIKRLADRYGVSAVFVRLAINRRRDSRRAEDIKKEYRRLFQALDDLFNQ